MQNLIEKSPRNKKDDEEGGEEKKQRPIIKSATDLQRLKLEKLMKNPDKPIIIPETPREKDYMQTVPSFVRNVMGSSAGAGSGEFHVYRHLRRKEYARQKCIHAKSMREQLDDEYQSKLEKNRLEAEAKTAKKRAKRLKKKLRAKKPKFQKRDESDKQNTTEDDDDEDESTNSSNKNEHEEIIEDGSPIETIVVNDNVEICKDPAGPQPKEEIEITLNKNEESQDKTFKTCLDTDDENNKNPDIDEMKNNNEKEIGFSGTEDHTNEKKEAEVEEQTTEEPMRDSTHLQS